MTMTGRRFVEDKSVNGIGTKTMSPCLGIVPIRVVLGIVPELKTCFGGVDQVGSLVVLGCEHDNFYRGARGNGHLELQLPFSSYLGCKSIGCLRHINSTRLPEGAIASVASSL